LYDDYKNDTLKLSCLNFILANIGDKYSVSVRYEDFQGRNAWNKLSNYKDGAVNSFLTANDIDIVADTIFDKDQLTAAYLGKTIDFAVQNYRTGAVKYSLDTFCNYVLPYRIGTEPLVQWRDSLFKMYKSYLYSNNKPVNDLALYKGLRKELDSWLKRDSPTVYSKFIQSPNQDVFTIKQVKYPYSCEVEALYTINTYRSLGIPSAYERIFTWGKFNFGHAHAAIMYSNGRFYPADWDTVKFKYQIAKMYRRSFSEAENPFNRLLKIGQDSINIPSELNFNNYIDITRERTEVSDIELTLMPGLTAKNPAAFLCVYNSGKWIPVAWSARNSISNSYRFKDMGRKILYHLAILENGKKKLVGDPLILDTLGRQQLVRSSKKTVIAKVKMFDRYHLIERGHNYTLFVWQSSTHCWEKSQSFLAIEEFITYNVPEKALLKIEEDNYQGDAVRPFTFDSKLNKQVWW